MKKIRVVQLIHGLNMGGAEALVKEYALRLDKNKFEVVILCYERLDSPYYKILEDADIPIIYACDSIPTWGKRDILSRIVNHFGLYFVLKKKMRKLKPDVVHNHLCLNRYIKFAHLPTSVRILYTQHFDVQNWNKRYNKDVLAVKFLLRHYRMKIIALSDEMRKKICDIFSNEYNNDITVLKNGIDIKKFKQAKSKEEIRKELGIAKDAFVVGHVGRFTAIKNHAYLLKVFREIKERNNRAILLLVGSGDEKRNIIEKSKEYGFYDNLMILSNRTDVHDLLRSMDVMVFPSISEGIPLTLIEAQISGLRCIVSNTVTSEIAISNLIKFKNIDDNPLEWAEIALDCKETDIHYSGVEEWDIDNVVRKLEKLYEFGWMDDEKDINKV